MSLSLFWNSRLLLGSFLRTHPSSVPSLSVGMLFCYLFSSFSHHNTMWDLTLIRFCCVFLPEISFLKLQEGGCIQGSFSNFTELPLLLLFCISMVAGFLRGPGSLLISPWVWTFLDFISTVPVLLPMDHTPSCFYSEGVPGLHYDFCEPQAFVSPFLH